MARGNADADACARPVSKGFYGWVRIRVYTATSARSHHGSLPETVFFPLTSEFRVIAFRITIFYVSQVSLDDTDDGLSHPRLKLDCRCIVLTGRKMCCQKTDRRQKTCQKTRAYICSQCGAVLIREARNGEPSPTPNGDKSLRLRYSASVLFIKIFAQAFSRHRALRRWT